MDLSDATGGAAKVRKKSHSANRANSIDVAAMSEGQVERFAGDKRTPSAPPS